MVIWNHECILFASKHHARLEIRVRSTHSASCETRKTVQSKSLNVDGSEKIETTTRCLNSLTASEAYRGRDRPASLQFSAHVFVRADMDAHAIISQQTDHPEQHLWPIGMSDSDMPCQTSDVWHDLQWIESEDEIIFAGVQFNIIAYREPMGTFNECHDSKHLFLQR